MAGSAVPEVLPPALEGLGAAGTPVTVSNPPSNGRFRRLSRPGDGRTRNGGVVSRALHSKMSGSLDDGSGIVETGCGGGPRRFRLRSKALPARSFARTGSRGLDAGAAGGQFRWALLH
ncbi:hypothetical protein LNKW23_37460 [Paralimibaculum aggregatum]|uniref:Uncharacterized protein n=1 Tax=Paralimibaculum aggregatum TaxID=3036245 RepID=A0ABQ6LPZ2_9RHOB|nr:hypothetical protein LNKW23_37460 [Limibaculum sp. NKW23]